MLLFPLLLGERGTEEAGIARFARDSRLTGMNGVMRLFRLREGKCYLLCCCNWCSQFRFPLVKGSVFMNHLFCVTDSHGADRGQRE